MRDHKPFTWWHVNEYGCAVPYEDCPAIGRLIDDPVTGRDWYGSIEGAIIHGGVQATAFKRTTSRTYDAARWLATGEQVAVGHVTVTEITAGNTHRKVWSEHT